MTELVKEATPTADRPLSRPSVVLVALTLVYAVNLLDRQIINVLAEPLKADLGLTDTQVGLLSGLAFAVFYTTLGLPMAMLSDRYNRVRIIAGCCLTWSIFTALCGMGASFLHLALSRVGVGIGEAGATPPSYSLVTDYFPPGRRAMALSVFTLGAPIGALVGALLAGTIGASYGWRFAFVVASVPGVIFAAALPFIVREPIRGRLDLVAEDTEPQRMGLGAFLRQFFQDVVLRRATVAGALAAFAFYGTSAWLPAFLMRERDMSLSEVGLYYSLGIFTAIALGQLSGGYFADKLAKRSHGAVAYLPSAMFLVGFPLFISGALSNSWPAALVLFLAASAAGIVYVGPTTAIIQEATAPHQRSLASAIFLFTVNIVGLGLGPLFVGYISDITVDMRLGGLTAGLLALSPTYVLAAIAFWLTGRALDRAPGRRCVTA